MLFVDGKLAEYNKTAPRPGFTYIDYGLSIVRREIIESYPANQRSTLRLSITRSHSKSRLHGYEVFRRFYEIGSPSGLKEADEFFRMGDMP